ncbi:MAG: putative peptidoglycan glycosyltransferase FtsW [Vampirovibrionales bacterium]|nr:putative peptidoglycan glycosyltransferase FtsW [Vampirovibrionales bacterium]
MRFWPDKNKSGRRLNAKSHKLNAPDLPPIMRFNPQANDYEPFVPARGDSRPVTSYEVAHQSHESAENSQKHTPEALKNGSVDSVLLSAVLILLVFGLLSVLSASAWVSAEANANSFAMMGKQLFFALLGLVAMRWASKKSLKSWNQIAVVFSLIVTALIMLTLVIGTTANGSSRWLALPMGIQFQPSELAKLACILLTAQALTAKRNFQALRIGFGALLMLLIAFLVLKQPNMSMLMLLLGTVGAMAFASRVIPVFLFVAMLPIGGATIWWRIQNTPYLWKRIVGWSNPWADPQGSGYNIIQSLYAIGNGGVLGSGWGQSIQKLRYLPFPHTDFIFSIICEELGVFGSLTLLGLFAVIAWRGFAIALRCRDPFGQFVALGITASIIIQALLNIAVAIGLGPVTGVTLPLVSYGGTSLLVTLLMIGVLLHCSRLTKAPEVNRA